MLSQTTGKSVSGITRGTLRWFKQQSAMGIHFSPYPWVLSIFVFPFKRNIFHSDSYRDNWQCLREKQFILIQFVISFFI